ncbi:hypothetical protein AAHA92_06931 [Salvia divinorum]|uniref:Maturase K n=1 Tax=Salvia divinorum TaxID=28513 RepID=A0ABD1I819_SALDI
MLLYFRVCSCTRSFLPQNRINEEIPFKLSTERGWCRDLQWLRRFSNHRRLLLAPLLWMSPTILLKHLIYLVPSRDLRKLSRPISDSWILLSNCNHYDVVSLPRSHITKGPTYFIRLKIKAFHATLREETPL